MNALVASVIRTYVPVIVGQVASWLLLAHIILPAPALVGLTAFVGGLLTAIYYGGVRILEQQWPSFGILLGLPVSPDTYSKDNEATADVPAAPTVNPAPVAAALAPVADTSLPAAADSSIATADPLASILAQGPAEAATFPAAAVDAASQPAS